MKNSFYKTSGYARVIIAITELDQNKMTIEKKLFEIRKAARKIIEEMQVLKKQKL